MASVVVQNPKETLKVVEMALQSAILANKVPKNQKTAQL